MPPSKPTPEPLTVDDSGPSAPRDPALPELLGRYRVVAQLGAGGFGVVYKGHDDDLRRAVAIKVPHRHRVSTPADVDAYLAEARVLASLNHPGIVPVYDVGRTDDGLCYVVSQFVDGSDLKARLEQGRPPLAEAVAVVASVAEALHYAHRKGLVHRDVKPANLLLDAAGRPVVADFGLALRDEEVGSGPSFVGTPAYMSPEQARGEGHRVDARTDVYSLGVVFYEMLTGRRPFTTTDRAELLAQIKTQEPRPPRQLDDAIPAELDRIRLKALAKRASDRYSTAADLAADLRHWQEHHGPPPVSVPSPPVVQVQVLPPVAADSVSAAEAATDTDRQSLKVVPKGLRSFDAGDADFFLELLPGPRDRTGLPDSLRFWKRRIEDSDPDGAFSVGLLYGPSGCGKSSLVKAGLLPHLAEHVLAVYVEATADDTETRLLRGLRKRCPTVPDDVDLVEALAGLRRGRGLPEGHKILLVLDQFEQWLHAKRHEEHTELVQALRQCDGRHVQALVLVRDDFWLAVSRFLRDLEVPLREGQNAALVDLFDPLHARKVLGAFGRAYGRLPTERGEMAPEQERFLGTAVAGLVQDGKIISVRLALFAEMVKGKPWTPVTLHAVGGAAGVGVTFLEETFSAATAPAEHRLHQQAARAVLKALLPEQGTDIKGTMRARTELLAASGYARRPDDFADLLRILDAELRLVTPTEAEGPGSAAPPAPGSAPHAPGSEDSTRGSIRSPPGGSEEPNKARGGVFGTPGGAAGTPGEGLGGYYQLTHDYLVPALRQWLTRKQRETRRGRAELRLQERAALWAAKPENRHLPAWWEWLNIRLFTRAREWTPPQRQLMRRATRHHGLRAALLLAALLFAGWGAWEVHGTLKANALVGALVAADTPNVPKIVDELNGYRRWADADLRQRAAATAPASRAHLHLALALLPADPGQADGLVERLLTARPDEVPVLRAALAPQRETVAARLWPLLEDPGADPGQRFRAACALAAYEPDSPRWAAVRTAVPNYLVRENPLLVGKWTEVLRPVRTALLPALSAIFRDRQRPESERSVATSLLADYAADRPEVLADLLLDADERQWTAVWPKLPAHREKAVALLNEELARRRTPQWQDPPLAPSWAAVPEAVVRQIEAAQGLVAERFALCQTLPLAEFDAVAEALRPCGYRPVNVRPYAGLGAAVLVAAVWTRDGKAYRLEHGLTAEDVAKRDVLERQKGFMPFDVAAYVVVAPAGAGILPAPKGRNVVAQGNALGLATAPPPHQPRRGEITFALSARISPLRGSDAEAVGPQPRALPWALALRPFGAGAGIVAPPRPKGVERYAVLWLQADAATRDAQLYVAVPEKTHRAKYQPLQKAGLVPRTLTPLDHDGTTWYSAVWWKPTRPLTDLSFNFGLDEGNYERTLSPSLLQTDVRLATNPNRLDQARREFLALFGAAPARGLAAAPWLGLALRRADEQPLDRDYATVSHASADFVSEEVHGLEPVAHLQRCRAWADQGYRPVALAVLAANGSVTTASVWQRPVVPEAAKDALAQRQAQAAVALLRLGEGERVWPLLKHTPDPRLRSFLIHRLSPLGADPRSLVRRLHEEKDISVRRALLLCLGEFGVEQLPAAERQALLPALLRTYRDEADPGLHAAVDWLLRCRWGQQDQLKAIDKELAAAKAPAERPWYVNGQGQTMVIVSRGPVEFWMGSPASEAGHNSNERLHRRRIPWGFALAAKGVTVEEFRRFNPEFGHDEMRRAPEPDCPILGVIWYEAAEYCNWLSKQEGLPEAEWCYEANPQGRFEEGMRLAPDWQERIGYRLPTEAEMEYACRAGAVTSRYYGNSDVLLDKYAWSAGNSRERTWPVGSLKPNDLGFFDLHGNLLGWFQDIGNFGYLKGRSGEYIEDSYYGQIVNERYTRVLRGGSFADRPGFVRSAFRVGVAPALRILYIGFRPARTFR